MDQGKGKGRRRRREGKSRGSYGTYASRPCHAQGHHVHTMIPCPRCPPRLLASTKIIIESVSHLDSGVISNNDSVVPKPVKLLKGERDEGAESE